MSNSKNKANCVSCALPRITPELLELGRATVAYDKLVLEWNEVVDTGWYIENGVMRHKHVDLQLKIKLAKIEMEKAQEAVELSAIEMYLTDQDMRALWESENSGQTYSDWLAKLMNENGG
jgi:flavin-binding protein dodecin